jgi:hypothetical protein
LGFLPRAVSRDFTDGSDGTIQETMPASGENKLLVHKLGQGPSASFAYGLAVRHQRDGAGRMRFAKLIAARKYHQDNQDGVHFGRDRGLGPVRRQSYLHRQLGSSGDLLHDGARSGGKTRAGVIS